MSTEVATIDVPVVAAAPSPAPKKAATPKKAYWWCAAGLRPKAVPGAHPPYANMVKAAIAELKDSKGSSRAAILKYIVQNYKVGENLVQVNARLRKALNSGTTNGLLKQMKGTGASGSFRLAGEKKTTEKKATRKVVKKPVAKKAAVASPSKPVIAKTNSAAAKPKAVKKTKSPAKKGAAKPKVAEKPKAAKPAAAKKTVKSPKKAAAKTPKKAAAKSPKKAAKKPATKKAVVKGKPAAAAAAAK